MRRSLLKAHAPLFVGLLRLLDPLLVFAVGAVVYRLYLGTWDLPDRYLFALVGLSALCAMLFQILGLYAPQRGIDLFDEVRRLVNAWLLLSASWFAFLFLSKSGADFSRAWSGYWIVVGIAVHLMLRLSLRLILRQLRRHGHNLRHIAIVGAGTLGREIALRLQRTPWSGFVVHGFYDDNSALHGQTVAGAPVVGPIMQLAEDLREHPLDQVWIALPLRAERLIRDLLETLQQHSVQVRLVPDIFNFMLIRHSFSEIAGLPVINITDSPLEGGNLALKNIEDFVLSTLIIVLASPLLLLIAIGVKLSSPGPVLYRQERLTWNGERFSMLKFRTMPVDSEAESGPVWARRTERRATPFGAFLRATSLDELPQFINVLRGEMSIVGPRPERPEFVERFKHEIPRYMQKHLVRAGITGWAQVNDLRGDTDLGRRIQHDLYYIENWSIWFDLRIIATTLVHIVRSRNAY